MKKIILFLFSAFVINTLQAQNPLLILPPNQFKGIVYSLPIVVGVQNDPTFPFDYYDGFSAKGSANGISDVHGDLSFFIVDGIIYDKDGKFVDLAFQDNQNQWDYAPTTSTICGYSVKYDGFMIGQETMIIPITVL